MQTYWKFVFSFSLILLISVGFQANAQKLSDESSDRQLRLESLLKLMPEELQTLRLGIDEVSISRLQENKAIDKSKDYEVYNLIDTAFVFSTTQNPTRYTYTYDEQGKLLIKMVKRLLNEQWGNLYFESLNYDEFDNVELLLSKVWEADSWVNSERISSEFIQNNLVKTATVETWDGEWQFQIRDSFNWYPGGNMASHLAEIWDGNDWENQTNILFIRDDNENLLQMIVQNWDGNNWKNTVQTLNTYNSSGLNDSSFVMIWNENSWEHFYLYTYLYDGQRLSSGTGSYRVDGEWEPDIKVTYAYNTDNLIETATSQNWLSGEWINSEQNNFYYNQWGSFETILNEVWETEDWVYYSMKAFIFDESGNALEGIVYSWENDSWQNTQDDALIMPYHFGIHQEAFTGYLVEIAYRSILVGEPENQANESLIVYPNPVSSVLNIENLSTGVSGPSTLILADQQGKIVFQKNLPDFSITGQKYTLDISDLSNGHYTVRIVSGNEIKTKKILIINYK